jgi:hypothetical protein
MTLSWYHLINKEGVMKILKTIVLVLTFCGAVGIAGQDADACGGSCPVSGGKTGTKTTVTEPAPEA